MTLKKQTIWSREHLIDLLDQGDIDVLWSKWNLPQNAEKDKASDEFIAFISGLSTTSLMQEILSLKTSTLQMIRDVIAFLSRQCSSLRTTGSIIVLDEEFDLTPQQIGSVLKWSQDSVNKHSTVTWENLNKVFIETVVPLFERIKTESEVETDEEEEDVVDAYIRSLGEGSVEIRRTTIASYDEGWLKIYEEYVAKLEELNRKLQALKDRELASEAHNLLSRLIKLYLQHKDILRRYRSEIRFADERWRKHSYNRSLSAKEQEGWKQFVEGVLFLSDIEESSNILDVLRLDLFRKRPQLYEIWILVSVASCFKSAGYSVEMLSLANSDSGRLVWNLNYAKSQAPVAKLVNPVDRSESFLFYQLFRPGEARDDMPDIALMPSSRAEDQPIWIIDPKHSEGRGYSLSSYREVALRYHVTFKPKYTWVVEYYPRDDIKSDNPLAFADNAELIRDVSPGGLGHKYFLSKLRECHGLGGTTTVIIDISSSFVSNLGQVKADLKDLRDQGFLLSDTMVLFSEEAKATSGLIEILDNDTEWPEMMESKGTHSRPLLRVLEDLDRQGIVAQDIRIYTDGDFQDASSDDVLRELGRYGNIMLIDFKSN